MNYLVSYDMNGPLARTDTSELVPHEGVREAIDRLPDDRDDVAVALNSGYDVETLRYFRDDLLDADTDMYIIGELGSVYLIDDDVNPVVQEEPARDLYELKQELYRQAAAEGRKIHEQGNVSNVVGCTRVEGEGRPGDPRGEVYRHHAVDPSVSTEEIYEEALVGDDRFSFDGELVSFDDGDLGAVERLADVLRYEFTFAGVRFRELEEGIGFVRDREDAAISLDEAHAFMERVVEGSAWDVEHNPDWGSDYMKQVETGKEPGAEALASELFDGEVKILHIGDKQSDVMDGFYALAGTEAARYAEENGVDHVVVEDAVAFTDDVLERIG